MTTGLISCTSCQFPLAPLDPANHRYVNAVLCDCCHWMLQSVVRNPWFIHAHVEWVEQQIER